MLNKYLISTEQVDLDSLSIGSLFCVKEINPDFDWIYEMTEITEKNSGKVGAKVVHSPDGYLFGHYTIMPKYLTVYLVSYLH